MPSTYTLPWSKNPSCEASFTSNIPLVPFQEVSIQVESVASMVAYLSVYRTGEYSNSPGSPGHPGSGTFSSFLLAQLVPWARIPS